jgi:hypothetical protein
MNPSSDMLVAKTTLLMVFPSVVDLGIAHVD